MLKKAINPINWYHEVRTEVWTFLMLIFIDLGDNKTENNSFHPRTNFVLHGVINSVSRYANNNQHSVLRCANNN